MMKIMFSMFMAVFLMSLTTLAPINIPTAQDVESPSGDVAAADVLAQPVQPIVQNGPPLVKDAQGELRYTPFAVMQMASQDIALVAALNDTNLRPENIRYLALNNIPEAKRPIYKTSIDRVLNGLNPLYRRIVRTAALPIGSPAPVLIRVNLQDYNIRPKAWDFLAENGSGQVPQPDPYFHEFVDDAEVIAGPPTVNVSYGTGAIPGKCEIVATMLADCKFYIGEQLVQQTGTVRKLTSPVVKLADKATYELWFTGTNNGKPYEVKQVINLTPGGLVQLQLAFPTSSNQRTYATARWLALEPALKDRGSTVANLIKLSNTSNPILRGDWFVNYATWGPAYYHLIGLDLKDNPVEADRAKTPKVFLEKDFERLFLFNYNEAVEDMVAAIADTKLVTLHNRILQRFSTVRGTTGGYYWRSQDSKTGIKRQDYMTNIETFANPDKEVQEIIASGRNNIDFYAITDNKGRLLDLADAVIAHHSAAMPTKLRDVQIYNARNCMLCHAGGLQQIDCKVRNLARGDIRLGISGYVKNRFDPDIARRITEAFEPNIKSIIDLDNAKFNAAVLAACGLPGRQVGSDFEDLITTYYDQPISLERMAWEAGMPPATLKMMLQKGVGLSYRLVGVLQAPEEAPAILPWEEQGYAELMKYIIAQASLKQGG